jgi:hypothetical protein
MISCGLMLYLGITCGPPFVIYNSVLYYLFSQFFSILFIFSGSSETQVFDEQSPSGNDYLAEVDKLLLISITINA